MPCELPALPPKDQVIPSVTFSKLQLTRDRLDAQVSEAHRWRIPCPDLERQLAEVEGHLATMTEHNRRIEDRHLRECAKSKAADRRKQAKEGRGVVVDQSW